MVADRYEVLRLIGSGGMAEVYEARELRSDRRVALKRLKGDHAAKQSRHRVGLFEREFHTLAHLAHPRIVEVYDYGIDESGPYYTMELLDGGDLHTLAPVEWRTACSVFRDVCSALSLLHSRRLVFRDLNTRNIRCTEDGNAKLIDFGAMVPMGPTRVVVGAPPCIAPEALHLQPIDGRADLYSVGAGLYYALAGRHAYPGRHLKQLRDLWRSPPTRLSNLVRDLPHALDDLVMELMQLDAAFRPVNAAEVMERLSAIAGLASDDTLRVSQAYLSTPTLVGRARQQAQVQRNLVRALRRTGSTTLITGVAGVGRSRFIDACVLDAKLAGATVLRADASDAQSGAYGAVRALALQLLDAAPEIACAQAEPRLPILAHVLPDLAEQRPGMLREEYADPEQLRARLLPAVRDWFLSLSERRPIVLAVDDVHAIDEPSAALLALLAHEAPSHALCLVVSTERRAPAQPDGALQVLVRKGTSLELHDLDAGETATLLGSVFGDAPHVAALAERLHALSAGNPRGVMNLAQHLVDRNVVRYESGAWILPAAIAPGDLPQSVGEALALRVARLSARAQELAQAIAISGMQALSFEDCLSLRPGGDAAALIADLDQLVGADVLHVRGTRYGIAQQALVPVLCSSAGAQTALLHRRLADMFRQSGQEFRVVQHVARAGDDVHALDLLIQHAERSQQATDDNPRLFFELVQSLPEDWYATYDRAIALCIELQRPRRQRFVLQCRLAGLMAVTAIQDTTHLAGLLELLHHALGLDLYAELDADLPALERLAKSFELAQKRHDDSPEDDRVVEPVQAIRPLARALIQSCAIIATRFDYAFWRSLPSLRPLIPLTPALWVSDQLVQGLGYRITGRSSLARQTYHAVLERTAQPDRAGLDESHHRYSRIGVMCGLGMLEAAMGREESVQWARQIESEPMHQVNAVLIRMLNHYWQGRAEDGDRLRTRMALLRIQNSSKQFFEGTHLVGEVGAHAALGDLPRLKRAMQELESLAADASGWVPVLQYAQGEHRLVLGEPKPALTALDAALAAVDAGEHQIWPNAAGARLRALLAANDPEQAVAAGRRYLAAAHAVELGYAAHYIDMPLAVAEARVGNAARAAERAEAVVESFRELKCGGINLGLAYETCARVALHNGERHEAERHATAAARVLRAGQSRAARARHIRLLQELREHFDGPQLECEALLPAGPVQDGFTSLISTLLHQCDNAEARAYQGLSILIAHSHSLGGYLYAVGHGGLQLAACIGAPEPGASIAQAAQQALDEELELNEEETKTGLAAPALPLPSDAPRRRFRTLVLSHQASEGLMVTGVAVLLIDPLSAFTPPNEIARVVSRLAVDAGDGAVVT